MASPGKHVLTLENFEASLNTTVLERGQDYFENDTVSDLTPGDDGVWTAIVTGNDAYRVKVKLSGEVISSCSCDCPHEAEYCKHIVATLFAIKEFDDEDASHQNASYKNGFSRTVDDLPEAKLRQFIIEYGNNNPDFRNLLQAYFSPRQETGGKAIYAKLIKKSAEDTGGRGRFIDYYNAGRFVRDIDKLLAQAHSAIRLGHYAVAVDIAFAVIENVHEILKDTDDSGGGIGGCIKEGFGILQQLIAEDIPFDLKDRIFRDAIREAKDPDYDYAGFDDEWLEVTVAGAYDQEKRNVALKIIDKLLTSAMNAKDEWLKEFDINRLIKHKLTLLRRMDLKREADHVRLQFLHLPDLRIEVIEEQIIGKNFTEAKKLIREGIKIAGKQDHPGTVFEFKKILLRIATEEHDTAAFRNIAKELYEKGRHMEYYKIIKDSYSKGEWPAVAETFINELHTQNKGINGNYVNDDSRLVEIFTEEKYWERMLQLIQNSTALHFVDRYAHLLATKYPREILLAYKEAIIKYATQNTGRNHYVVIRETLRKLLAWEGGRRVVEELVDQFTVQYKARKAMIEELAKIG